MVRVKEDGPPLNTRPNFRDKKVLCSNLFDTHGPVAQIIVSKGRTINEDFCAINSLSEVENTIENKGQSQDQEGSRYYMIMQGPTKPSW